MIKNKKYQQENEMTFFGGWLRAKKICALSKYMQIKVYGNELRVSSFDLKLVGELAG
jgi:hypothetical protein